MLISFSLASRKTQVYCFVNLSSVPQKHQGKFWTKDEFERATIASPKVYFQISLHQVDSTRFWHEDLLLSKASFLGTVCGGEWPENSALHASHSRTWRSDSAPLQKIPCPPEFLAFVLLGFLAEDFPSTSKQLQNHKGSKVSQKLTDGI